MEEMTLTDRIANTWIDRLLQSVYSKVELFVMKFYDKELTDMIGSMPNRTMKPSEMAMVYYLAKAQTKTEGDFAEVGVGASTVMIAEAKGSKTFHVFDTFGGIPYTDEIDVRFKERMFIVDSYEMANKLKPYPHINQYKGIFPKETSRHIKNTRFAFVHLDVDTYRSTKDCLKFFSPRMNRNGIILTHDYSSSAGVRKAFDESFKNIIQLPMSQAMVIRR